MPAIDKERLVELALEHLAAELASMTASAQATQAGATHAENKPENSKDTRGLEQSYLARGQAERVVGLQQDAAELRRLRVRAFAEGDAVGLSALVEVEVDDAKQHYFLVPAGGGMALEINGVRVRMLSPKTPVGRALMGRMVGDDVEVRVAGRLRELMICELS